MARNKNLVHVMGRLTGTPWAIRPEALNEMLFMAQRLPVDIVALASGDDTDPADGPVAYTEGGVAVIPVRGPIFQHASWLDEMCGATSYERIESTLWDAFDDSTVDAIVLNISSPGGEVDGCSELAKLIRKINATKPVIAYASGSICSAAYWLGSACSTIVVSPTSVVGCLGVAGTIRDTRQAEEKMGIKSYEIVSSQTPDKRPDVATDDGRAQIVAMIDAMADVFLNDVAANRGIERSKVDETYGKGGVFVGALAVSAGLADAVGTLGDVIDDLLAVAA